MGRPSRNDVDYFPFLCKEGKAMFIIDKKWGNDGYAIWIKTLRALAVTNHHFLDFRKKEDVFFHAVKCNVSEELLFEVLFELAKMGEFDLFLWNEGIVYSDKFIENISEAYKKRNNQLLKKEELILQIGIKVHDSGVTTSVNSVKVPVKPHTILDYTILEKEKNLSIKNSMLAAQSNLETAAMKNNTSVENIVKYFNDFWHVNDYDTNESSQTEGEIRIHFNRWLGKNKPPQIKFVDEWGEYGEDYYSAFVGEKTEPEKYKEAIDAGFVKYSDSELRFKVIKKTAK